jgi:hypothetical protein
MVQYAVSAPQIYRSAVERRITPMTDNKQSEKAQAQLFFEGLTGRSPKTDKELEEWLATPEAKVAMAFELTSLSPWGEKGRA